MNISKVVVTIGLLGALNTCGSDNETNSQEPTPQGVISSQQQEALDAANSVEQILLDASEERRKELEARLQTQ